MARRPSSASEPTDAARHAVRDDAHASLSSRAILCAVLDGAGLGEDARKRAAALFRAGVDWIQLRDRALPDAALYALATALVAARDEACANAATGEPARRVLVNRRLDIALAVGADGVHLGFDAVKPGEARRLLGPDALVGASLHSIDEVEAAAAGPLSYAHLAPIWPPLSKPASRPALGTGTLARAGRPGLPLLAQGGLDPQRALEAVRAGAAGIAVTGALTGSGEATRLAGALRRALDGAHSDDDSA
jgi:thiamine-phosphate pyrophosphorylase